MSWGTRVIRNVAREVPAVAGLLLITILDYVTGPRVAVSPFYLAVLVPIALRRRAPVAAAYGAVAAAMFLAVDLISGPIHATGVSPYWREFYPYWRGVAQLISFSVVMFTIPRLIEERHRLLRSEETLVRQRSELEDLNAKLVGVLEELGAARQRTVEAMLNRQTTALDELKALVATAVAEGPRKMCVFDDAVSSPSRKTTGGTDAPETL
jgi:hypothetical protein